MEQEITTLEQPEEQPIEQAEPEQSEVETADKEQSKENFAFANMRIKNKDLQRQLEDAKAAREADDAYFADMAKKAGFDDVTNLAEYRAKLEEQERNKTLKTKGIDPDIVATIAAAVQPQQQRQPMPARDIMNDIQEINAKYGTDYKSLEEFSKEPFINQILDMMDNNKNLLLGDAFYAVNASAIQNKQKAAATQQAANQAKGYSHIQQSTGGGDIDNITVTQDEIKTWRKAGFTKDEYPDPELIKMIKKQKEAGW